MTTTTVGTYAFNPRARTVSLTSLSTVEKLRVISIYDETIHTLLYSGGNDAQQTTCSGKVLTLPTGSVPPSARATDVLRIVYDTTPSSAAPDLSSIIGGAPSNLDTLGEVATALGTKADAAATTAALALKADANNPQFTGRVQVPTPIGAADAANRAYADSLQGLVMSVITYAGDLAAPRPSGLPAVYWAGFPSTPVNAQTQDVVEGATFGVSDVTGLQTALDAKAALASAQLYGSGVPASSLGLNGDKYTDLASTKQYTKALGAWTVTNDPTVTKEAFIPGAWSTTAGTLSADNTDGVTAQKLVSATTGNSIVTYTFTNPVDFTNKVLRMAIRVDNLSDWATNTGPEISDTVGFTGRISLTAVGPDYLRGGEVEALQWCPNTGYFSGTPALTAIKYLRIVWTLAVNGTARNAYMGQPVVIG